ncbi:MAG: multidrug ABC transporter permease [Geobacteraceae bacterium GWC2_55_20]|nr:MAG: multidrug ABC transporter permease [Geobacteraceae bacterium GWC2_55_20]OGU19648.1 MAG: multidrug ABC transporter permease [Geobacteraceae bacterium GWF2_54_21]HBA73346.1 multidrug ABC transporter permease [Geobacter sp.]HCE67496.1 multidrug ABC transporter permease [Geobacter sp.]
MKIPFEYSFRNLYTRRFTTFLTATGMAMVVFVFASINMLSAGLEKTLVETGSDDNVIITRKAANSEVQSGVERSQAAIIESIPDIATDRLGEPLLAKELVVLISLPKRGSNKPANVVIRGIHDSSLRLRNQIRVVKGRMPRPGSSEIIAGSSIAKRFKGGGIGENLRFGMRDWTVVGVFDAGATGFSSEIWGDATQLMQAFRRPVYSSVTFRLRNSNDFESVKAKLDSDPRLTVDVRRETRYYRDQSEAMAKFLRILGVSLTVIFSIGAVIGAMITMYAAVSNRVAEIGTLRALGFQRTSILASFLAEALLLGLAGGIGGLVLASFMQLITISTMNWQTFSELAFSFTLTIDIVYKSLLFSLVMGFTGGVIPAIRASRMTIVDALRDH